MKPLLAAVVAATVATLGNPTVDFSHAGFKGGGVALPNVHVARRLQPAGGDDTPQIQAAIDEISRLPMPRVARRESRRGRDCWSSLVSWASRRVSISRSSSSVSGQRR